MKKPNIVKSLLAVAISTSLLTGCGGGGSGSGDDTTNTTDHQKALGTDGNTASKNGTNTTNKTNGSVSEFNTQSNAQDLAASKDALFVAEGDSGVEIIKIGYQDRIDHEIITTISGINAKHVSLSDDQTKLYIENNQGFINIFDISDIKSPKKERIVSKQSLQNHPISQDGRFEYVPKEENGLIIYDVSNPSNKSIITTYKKSPVYDIALVDHDTKAIVATKSNGLDILKIDDLGNIKVIANEPLGGDVLGVSINQASGLLFVANGDKGIKVYNLNLLLDSVL